MKMTNNVFIKLSSANLIEHLCILDGLQRWRDDENEIGGMIVSRHM